MSDLSKVKEGDRLILHHRHYSGEDDLSLVEIERTTATQIIVKGVRYSRETGKQVASGWKPNYVELPTPELTRKARCMMAKAFFVTKLSNMRWEQLDSLTLGKVVAILKQDGAFEETRCTE